METKIGDLVRMRLGYSTIGIIIDLYQPPNAATSATADPDLLYGYGEGIVMWQDSPSPFKTREWLKDLKAAS